MQENESTDISFDFEVVVTPEVPTIQSTLADLRTFVETVDASYVSKPITLENVKEAKSSLADFRKIKKAVLGKMKDVKDEILKPWNELNDLVVAELNKLDHIEIEMNAGISAVVEAERLAKHQAVVDLIAAERAKLSTEVALVIKDYFDPRWENKTTTDKEIIKDFQRLADAASATVSAIKGNKHEAQLLGVFQDHFSYSEVSLAIERYRAQDEQMAKIEEARALRIAQEEENRKIREAQEAKDRAEAKARAEAAAAAAAEAAANAEPEEPAPVPEPVRQPSIMDPGILLTCTFLCCGTKENIAEL
ncbi:MAG: DUF1351 domain-containing protein, partial [Sphaerochaetaceae bacterium]